MVVHAASYQDEDDDDDEPTTFDIHDVARKGQLKPLSKLLKRAKEFNIDVNEVDEDGRTPLMLACRGGQGKAVEYLMQAGASPDIKDNEGYAAIHFSVLASVDRFVGIGRAASGIRALSKYRAFMDRKTADGFTAVHIAVKVRATDIISQLKDFGCDLDKFSTDGVNAVYLACHTAAEDKTVTPVISLMQLGARIDRVDPVFYRSALHKACDEELPEICRFLVLSKASVVLQDKQGDTPLHIVAKRGSTRTLEVICQALVGGEKVAINPDREKEDLEQKLEKISELADEAKIKSIMSIPDPAGDTPLHVACSFGYEMLVNMLIRNGADPEKKNFPSRKGVAQDANARPDKKSKRKKKNQDAEDESKAMGAQGGGGKTPYHVTAEVGHTELFKIFVRKGIDTSGVDENGHTCLHYAAMNNDVEIAEIQFECDPNPNVLTTAGWTPLHYAAAYDSVHVIVFLLDAGADPTIENNQGHTPSMLAGRSRTKKALEGLLKETLKREELEREQRERALLEDRKRLMAEMENEAALRNQQKQPLLSPRHDSDEEDEHDPLANIVKEEKAAAKPDPERKTSRPSSARSGTSSTKAGHRDNNSPRTLGFLTARTNTSDMSIKSHPPPKDEKWARWKYDMKKKWGPVYEKRIGPIKEALKPLLQHPKVVKTRKQLKYLTDRFSKRVLPGLTGEYPPSEISSYKGTTGFTSAPTTARSQLTGLGGSFTNRPGSRGATGPSASKVGGLSRPSSAGSQGSQRSALKGASPAGTPRSNKSVQFGGIGGVKMPKIRIPKMG